MGGRPAFRQWQIWFVPWRNDAGGESSRRSLLLSSQRQVDSGILWFACIQGSRPQNTFFTTIRKADYPDAHARTGLSYDLCYVNPISLRLLSSDKIGEFAGELPLIWHRDVAIKRRAIDALNEQRRKAGTPTLPAPNP